MTKHHQELKMCSPQRDTEDYPMSYFNKYKQFDPKML